MCERLIFLVSFVLVLALLSNASALDVSWTNGSSADSLWSTPTNWSAGVPESGDRVISDIVPGPTIDSNTTAECTNMLIGLDDSSNLDIIGGSLNNAGYLSIAHNPGSNGTVNVSGGATVSVVSLYVPCHGSATLNVSGNSTTIDVNGTMTVCNSTHAVYGHTYLYSGTLSCEDLTGVSTGNELLIDIYEGTFIVRNKTGAPMQNWVDNHYIIAYGGAGEVVITKSPEDWDVLTAEIDTIVVDDFDSYADSADLRNTWVENKAGVVHLEETIAHDGNSMKIVYDGASPYYYEAVRTYGTAQDWTVYDIKALDVWFRGKSTNDVEQMYVTLSDGTNSATVVNDDPDPNAVKSETWQVWHIDLQDFTDVNLASVEEISIGLGDGISPAGLGEVYFDDVALFPSRCFDGPAMNKGDINSDCAIDFKDIAILVGNWLESGMWP